MRIDGNDVLEVYRTARTAVETIRRGRGPVFIECMTYRWREHVGPQFDHELGRTYRTREEVEAWMRRCPVKRSEDRLEQSGIATRAQLAEWHSAAKAEVVDAVERARNAAWPEIATLFDFV